MNKQIVLTVGQKGTTSGFPAVVVRHYDGNMYEIRVPGGLVCIDASEFIPDTEATILARFEDSQHHQFPRF